MRIRKSKQIWFVMLGVFVAVFLFTFLTQKFGNENDVDAASLANFDAGYIISDYQMGNYNSMSEADIQAFLTSKNSCSNTNYNYYVSLSRSNPNYWWHWANGHFVCLSEERFGDGETIGSGETAAHIIWQAAQDFRINPKVIIVLLQKETGLITDPIPNNGDYRKATGYGCPDTAACSSKYYGFKNQVRNAASLFRTVLDGGWTNYPLGNNYIQYNPNAACGGSWVNIRSRATSALYRYTPYQPNAGALAAGYGATGSCGAYGNRNFYLYFQDWFGGITDTQRSSKVPDGTYYLQPSSNGSIALDVTGNSNANGANVGLYDFNYSDVQKWNITYNSATDDYNIKNAITGKALDVESAGTNDGTNVQIYDFNGTCAQRWKIINTSGSGIKVLSACSSKALDIANAEIKSGTNVQLWTANNTAAQEWTLTPVNTIEEGLYTIRIKSDSNKVLDISGGVKKATLGTNVQLYERNNTGAQRWRIEKTSDGYYVIKNPQSGKVLDVAAANSDDGTNVQIYDWNGSNAQKWKVLKNSDDSYTFISACGNKTLDLQAGDTRNGSNVQIYSANNTDAQKWTVEKIEIIENSTYNIISALSANKVVDITANSNLNGTNIQLYDRNGTNAQKWRVAYDKNTDLYTITNPGTGKALDVAAAGTWNGTNVQLYEKNGTCAQKWIIYKTGSKYVIASSCSELALDVSAGSTANGANIQLYEKNGTNAQKWSFVK